MTGQLKDNDMDQLESWIGGGPKTFTLLYSATKDGCVANTFHQKCDNQGPTVTVLYNPQGSVYGGYTGQSWNVNTGGYINDATAFLFQLKYSGNKQCSKFPIVTSTHAIYSTNNTGPTFGGGHNLCTFTGTINATNGIYALNGGVNVNETYYKLTNVSASVKTWTDIHNGNLNVTDIEVYKVTGNYVIKLYLFNTEVVFPLTTL